MTPELSAVLERAFGLLAEGAANRRMPLHTPALATVGRDGRPRIRTVVLRGVDAEARTVRFHTDSRSDKISELADDPRYALLGYDADAKVQIRVEGLSPEVTPGRTGVASLVLSRREDVLVVPRRAVQRYSSRRYVNVLVNGVRVERDVEVGLESQTESEIVAGLAEGDEVVLR